MADENSNIQFNLVVKTDASQNNVTTLKQDINNLQAAIEKASKTGLKINIDGFDRSIREAQEIQGKFIAKLQELNNQRLDNVNKTLNKEIELERKAAETKLNEEIKMMERAEKAQDALFQKQQRLKKFDSDYLKQYSSVPYDKQIEFTGKSKLPDISKNAKDSADVFKQQFDAPKLVTYQQQLSNIRKEQELLHQQWVNSGRTLENYKSKMSELNSSYIAISNQAREFNGVIAKTNTNLSYLGSFSQKFRSHFNWLVAGSALAGIFAIPSYAFSNISKIEEAMAGMQQVSDELHGNQQKINKEAEVFIDLSAVYGEHVEEMIKAGQSWGRMYKDLNIVNALTHQSAMVAVADNMSLIEANKGVEASMFQYGLVAKTTAEALAYSGRIIDVVTKLAHKAGTTAQDLFAAIERTGSVARQAGVDFEFLSAMVATATRSTQLSGQDIGNMFKSVLGSIHSDKATKEIEALGIATKKLGKDGTVELRRAQDVLLDIAITAQGTEKNLEDLYKAVSGGRLQFAA